MNNTEILFAVLGICFKEAFHTYFGYRIKTLEKISEVDKKVVGLELDLKKALQEIDSLRGLSVKREYRS